MSLSSINNERAVNIDIGSVQLPEQANAVIPAIPIELVNLVFSHLLLQYPHNMPPTRVCESWHKIGVKQIIAKELSLYGQFIQEMISKLDPIKDEEIITALNVLKESLVIEELNVNDLVGLKSRLQYLKDGTIEVLMALETSKTIQLDFKLRAERPLLFKNMRTVISIKKAVKFGTENNLPIRDQVRRALKDNELNLAKSIVKGLPLECQGPMLEFISVSSLLSQRKLAEAEKIADSISDKWARSAALEKVVQYLLSQNKPNEALEIAYRMPDLCIKSCVFNDIASALIKSMEEEVGGISRLSNQDERDIAIKELFERPPTFTLLQQVKNLRNRAEKAIEEATQLAFSLSESPEKNFAIMDVVYSLMLQEKLEEAEEILSKVKDICLMCSALGAIREILAAETAILSQQLIWEKGEVPSLRLQNEFKNLKVRQLCSQFLSARI